jgi:hypothetical protein
MEPAVAHTIASQNHADERNRFGDRVIDHVERVAAAVPTDALATALLHDVLEVCPTGRWQLRGKDLTRTELEALELLTHAAGESYERYVRRIADARGPAGRLARIVKLADLEDHLAHAELRADAPPYAWARRQVLAARDRAGDAAAGTPPQTRRPAVPGSGGASNLSTADAPMPVLDARA